MSGVLSVTHLCVASVCFKRATPKVTCILTSLAAPNMQQVSDGCQQEISLYQDALLTFTPWALQMLDASSSFPDGLLSDGGPRLGHFDECVAAAAAASPIGAKYCTVRYAVPPGAATLPASAPLRVLLHGGAAEAAPAAMAATAVDLAVCVPAACNATEAIAVAAHNLRPHLNWLGGHLEATQNCFEPVPWDAACVAFFVVAALLAAAAIAASFQTKFVPWLSARRNMSALLARSGVGTIECMHGMRFLSIAWVMFGHKFYYSTFVAPPPTVAVASMPWTSGVLLNSYLGVDTFLLLSALLAARAVAAAATLHVPLFYALRFARIWPPLAAIVFFTAAASAVIGGGPLWGPLVASEAAFCRNNWWSTLLFLNNYLDADENSCLSYSWFLSVDMQLAWLSPLVLIPLLRWRKVGVALALVLILVTTSALFTVTFLFELPWTLSLVSNQDKIVHFWKMIYTNTPMRAQPYLVGLLLGFFLERPTKRPSKWCITLAWVCSLVLMAFVLFGLMLSHDERIRDVTWVAALYGSTHRLVWSLALAWIIYSCHKGFGGWINDFLSLRIWVPLSRLTFCLFLTHLPLMTIATASCRSHSLFSIDGLIHSYVADVAFALVPALALHLTVEAPVNALIKSIMAKHNLKKNLNKK